ncbi:YlxR family protein [Deinococcus navajonensis]|uniref:YlxR family protein n=1 Tax=Deinococcus navajonensis TaxID=309884 RepID=A0ABV8XLB2_9DEIO
MSVLPAGARPRHIPERSCVACRRKRPQGEFVRLSRTGSLPGGRWEIGGKPRTGRGAYVCADSPECWQDKRLRRAFGVQASRIAAELSAQASTHQPMPD